jgi:hypothetical protein
MGSWDDIDLFARALRQPGADIETRIYAAVPLRSWEKLRDAIAAKT